MRISQEPTPINKVIFDTFKRLNPLTPRSPKLSLDSGCGKHIHFCAGEDSIHQELQLDDVLYLAREHKFLNSMRLEAGEL